MIASYEQRRDVRGIPATWEIIHGAAFGAGGGASDMGGEVHVPVSSLKVRARGS